MAHRDRTYTIFDGDKDMWAYRFMRGWKAQKGIDFDFYDAHDIQRLTLRAQDEGYIKNVLRGRMAAAKQALVLIGESTKHLYKYVRWEIDLAEEKQIPIIAVNLNQSRRQDDRCPPIIRDRCVLHVPFRARVIKYALDNWPQQFNYIPEIQKQSGHWYYGEHIYEALGLNKPKTPCISSAPIMSLSLPAPSGGIADLLATIAAYPPQPANSHLLAGALRNFSTPPRRSDIGWLDSVIASAPPPPSSAPLRGLMSLGASRPPDVDWDLFLGYFQGSGKFR